MLGRHILIQFAVFQKSGLLAEIGHFEVFSGIFGVTDLTLGHPRVAPEGFFLLYYPYPVPKLLAEAFLGLGPDLVHLSVTSMLLCLTLTKKLTQLLSNCGESGK